MCARSAFSGGAVGGMGLGGFGFGLAGGVVGGFRAGSGSEAASFLAAVSSFCPEALVCSVSGALEVLAGSFSGVAGLPTGFFMEAALGRRCGAGTGSACATEIVPRPAARLSPRRRVFKAEGDERLGFMCAPGDRAKGEWVRSPRSFWLEETQVRAKKIYAMANPQNLTKITHLRDCVP